MKIQTIAVIVAVVLALAALIIMTITVMKISGQCYHGYLPKVHTPVNFCPGQIRNAK